MYDAYVGMEQKNFVDEPVIVCLDDWLSQPPHQILCSDVCGTLDAFNRGVDRSLKPRIERMADMGFLFRLDQCDQNVTGICPLQSIPVTISHIRVGSVCVRD